MSGLRVAALVGGATDPSSRFRVLQHAGRLAPYGVSLSPLVPVFSSFPPRARALRPAWGAAALVERLCMASATRRFELTLFQKTMISTLSTFEGRCRAPRVLDVDDPIHVLRGGEPARRVAEACDMIICGNAYLAERYRRWNRRVRVLPTAVDTARWKPAPPCIAGPRAGWIGSSSNLPYLEQRQAALRAFLDACPGWTLRVVADRPPRLASLPADRWRFIRWSPEVEVAEVAGLAIGLMPLKDGEIERGKCSFKMLQYMACGVPVVVSPVGMNAEVLERGECGYGAVGDDGWAAALVALARDESLRRRMGARGRAIVEREFSSDVIAPRLAELLLAAAGR